MALSKRLSQAYPGTTTGHRAHFFKKLCPQSMPYLQMGPLRTREAHIPRSQSNLLRPLWGLCEWTSSPAKLLWSGCGFWLERHRPLHSPVSSQGSSCAATTRANLLALSSVSGSGAVRRARPQPHISWIDLAPAWSWPPLACLEMSP